METFELPLLYSSKLLCRVVEQKTLKRSGQTFSRSMALAVAVIGAFIFTLLCRILANDGFLPKIYRLLGFAFVNALFFWTHMLTCLATSRVTGVGEILRLGQLFTLGSFFNCVEK
jgi:hypothetical protein